jgi:hypothetical protein
VHSSYRHITASLSYQPQKSPPNSCNVAFRLPILLFESRFCFLNPDLQLVTGLIITHVSLAPFRSCLKGCRHQCFHAVLISASADDAVVMGGLRDQELCLRCYSFLATKPPECQMLFVRYRQALNTCRRRFTHRDVVGHRLDMFLRRSICPDQHLL